YTADVVADRHVWSQELYRIFEIDPAVPISNNTVRSRVHPEDLPTFDAAFERSASEGADFDQVFRIVTTNGKLKHVHSVAHVMECVEARPVFIGAIQDITMRRVAEQALKASEAELRRAVAHFTAAQRVSATGSFISDLLIDDHIWSEEMYR